LRGPDFTEETRPILTHLVHPLFLSLFAFRQSPFFDPAPITLKPSHRHSLFQPLRFCCCYGVECGSHRLSQQFQTIETTNCCQHMGGVGALHATLFDPALFTERFYQMIKEPLAGLMGHQTKPGSVNSNPSRYFQPIRPRTASAACRSERSPRYCSTQTNASRQAASAG